MKMKEKSGKLLGLGAAALLLAALVLFTGCPNSAGGSGSGSSGGGGTPAEGSFEDAGDFVKITPPANGIVGVDPDYTLPYTDERWKGVFIAGRKVKLSPYKLGKTEVTYELWYSVLKWNTDNGKGYVFANQGREGSHGTDGALPTEAGKKEPVTMVSWRDCIVWCNAYTEKENSTNAEQSGDVYLTKLNSASGAKKPIGFSGLALPAGETWETLRDELTRVAVYDEWWNGTGLVDQTPATTKTAAVKSKDPNALGLHDMSGNVWEWCFDWYGDIAANTVTDPQGAASGSTRVVRGGSWNNNANNCTVGKRNNNSPDNRNNNLGFRLRSVFRRIFHCTFFYFIHILIILPIINYPFILFSTE